MSRRKKQEEVVLPRRYEVYGVQLASPSPLPGRAGANFAAFAENLEYILNDVSHRGASIMQVQFIEGHGAVVVVDTQRSPLLSVTPRELLNSLRPDATDEDSVPLDEKLQEALGLFIQRAESQRLAQDSPAAEKALREVFRTNLRGLGGDRLQSMLSNVTTFIEKHRKSCTDGDNCKTVRLLRLAERVLSESMRESLQ